MRAFSLAALTLAVACVSGRTAETSQTSETNTSVTIKAGVDWIPLQPELEIEPGSALDFSNMGFRDAPAGKRGQVMARPDGQFAFVDSPDKPARFYGVNFCFSSLYLSHEQADRLTDRLARIGYNAARIHHYEGELTQRQTNSTTLNPEKLEQLDYLVAAFIRHGIYLTTDLFVSRGIPYREVGIDRPGQIPMDTFKILVPVHEGAYKNWQAFARNFLSHVNPYTMRSYAEEPALAWLAMINEGNFGNFFQDIQTIPEWKRAWNAWLVKHYQNRAALSASWGATLKPEEEPVGGTVEFPPRLQADGLRARDCIQFLGNTERDMVERMKKFLHDELHCRALISNSSSWTRFTTDQATRAIYDYVDDHFYVDHPKFLQNPWRLPSKCPNTSPLTEGATGGRALAFTRLYGKPFTVTEYNYSAPGRFRGIGGILTGALGALQGWGGIWRFAYSHNRESTFSPMRMDYFNTVSDPLSQAAERASLCLFLRGDLQAAPHSVVLAMTDADLARPAAKIPTLAPNWHWLAWGTRVGTEVVPSPDKLLAHDAIIPLAWATSATAYDPSRTLPLEPYALQNPKLISGLEQKKLFSPETAPEPDKKLFRSETGEIVIDGPENRLVLDTPRTAGGYAAAGQTVVASRSGVHIKIEGSDATVWVSALDNNPISSSKRLLVTHLTDLQNTNIRYAEPARQTLLDWGGLPYLVRAGKSHLCIPSKSTSQPRVWALSLGGKRLAEVPAKFGNGKLEFTADVSGNSSTGARMLYEIVTD